MVTAAASTTAAGIAAAKSAASSTDAASTDRRRQHRRRHHRDAALARLPPTWNAPQSFNRPDDPTAARRMGDVYVFRVKRNGLYVYCSDVELSSAERRRSRQMLRELGLSTA